jgi:hypothetical protein
MMPDGKEGSSGGFGRPARCYGRKLSTQRRKDAKVRRCKY